MNTEASSSGVGGSIAWTSDYVLRGVSQSLNQPALQMDIHFRPVDPWIAGAWASTMHAQSGVTSAELDFYFQRNWQLNQDIIINVSGTHYQYVHDPRFYSYRYDELSVTAGWADMLYGKLIWSPDADLYQAGYVYQNQQTLAVEAGYHQPLPEDIDFQMGGGFYDPLEHNDGRYAYGNAGLSRRFGHLQVELNYFWVQSKPHRLYNQWPAGGPWVATLIWKF